jgi:hypothetical protein
MVSISTIQGRGKEQRQREDEWKSSITNTLTRLETRQQVMSEQMSSYQQSLAEVVSTVGKHTSELAVVGIIARRADDVSKKVQTDLTEVKTDVRNLGNRIEKLEN